MSENQENADTPQPPGPAGEAPGATTSTTTQPPPAEPPAPPPAPRPPLRRSVTDRKIAGVAGGLGRYFGIDPLIFRVVFVSLAIFGGSGLLLYAVGWLLVPEEGEQESEAARLINGRATSKVVGGVVLAIVGLAVVSNFARTGFGFGGFAALVAIGVAAYLISREGNRPLVAPYSAPSAAAGPSAPGAYGQTPGTAYAGAAASYAATGHPPVPGAAYPPAATATPDAPTQPLPQGPPPPGDWYALPPSPPRRPRSPLGRVTVSLTLLTAGALLAWNVATTHDVPLDIVLACCLSVVGAGLVVGAVFGRARGLIFLGLLLLLATTVSAVLGVGDFRGGTGDRIWAPSTVTDVRATYRLAFGRSTLDLSRLRPAAGEPVHVRLRQSVGQMIIVLPSGVPVDVAADVRAGVIQLPDSPEIDGTSVHRRYVDPRDGALPAITIDAELGAGDVEVRRATP
ncbi:MAG: hypothetical protein QOI54_503 [Actinomycetota bacterium]|jgi:phage shock protein PspC (stress-responsive transcriptional regulator)|nr:hypothetical protein [Actinomycetota bacterium]